MTFRQRPPRFNLLIRLAMLLSLLLLLLAPNNTMLIPITHAAVSSTELAIGDWDMSLHGRSMNRLLEQQQQQQRPAGTMKTKCLLSLCDDGTFVLKSKNDSTTKIRGQWKIQKNPYCLTDRYYDQLLLKTYPRVQGNRVVICQGACRLYGHYSSKATQRLTHGAWVWKERRHIEPNEEDHVPMWTQVLQRVLPRKVAASFSAQKSTGEPSEEGWEDLEYFGY